MGAEAEWDLAGVVAAAAAAAAAVLERDPNMAAGAEKMEPAADHKRPVIAPPVLPDPVPVPAVSLPVPVAVALALAGCCA